MKVGELRIGNIIYSDQLEPLQVCTLGKNTIEITRSGKDWSTCFRPQPIPLTKEWFNKFGFIWNDKHCLWKNGSFILCQWNNPIYKLTGDVNVELKYVHQLQNLYFALTGLELEIKEQCQA